MATILPNINSSTPLNAPEFREVELGGDEIDLNNNAEFIQLPIDDDAVDAAPNNNEATDTGAGTDNNNNDDETHPRKVLAASLFLTLPQIVSIVFVLGFPSDSNCAWQNQHKYHNTAQTNTTVSKTVDITSNSTVTDNIDECKSEEIFFPIVASIAVAIFGVVLCCHLLCQWLNVVKDDVELIPQRIPFSLRRTIARIARERTEEWKRKVNFIKVLFMTAGLTFILNSSSDCAAACPKVRTLIVAITTIQYVTMCFPCVILILFVPILCLCMPCIARYVPSSENGARRTPGATRQEIESLSSQTFDSSTSTWSMEERVCAVCLDDYSDGDIIRILPCSHHLHQKCVDSWLELNGSCPVCRHQLFKDTSTNQRGDDEERVENENSSRSADNV